MQSGRKSGRHAGKQATIHTENQAGSYAARYSCMQAGKHAHIIMHASLQTGKKEVINANIQPDKPVGMHKGDIYTGMYTVT